MLRSQDQSERQFEPSSNILLGSLGSEPSEPPRVIAELTDAELPEADRAALPLTGAPALLVASG